VGQPKPLATGTPRVRDIEPTGIGQLGKLEFPARIPFSLPTGTWVIRPRGIGGKGSLRIENGTGLDAAVKLVTSTLPRKTIWMLYVRSKEAKAIDGVRVGSYLLRFALGMDWDIATRKFFQNQQFYDAGGQLEFSETETESSSGELGIKYTEIEISLNEVPFGNLQRAPINETVFDEGDPAE